MNISRGRELVEKKSKTLTTFSLLKSTSKPTRLMILRTLKIAREPMTFSKIKETLKKNGEKCHDGQLWKDLRNLVESRLVEPVTLNENVQNQMIRPRVFYRIRPEGELMLRVYSEVEKKIREIRANEDSPPSPSFLKDVFSIVRSGNFKIPHHN